MRIKIGNAGIIKLEHKALLFILGRFWLAYTPIKSPLFLSQGKFKKMYISKLIKFGTVKRGIR
jgi:hypothetical protein